MSYHHGNLRESLLQAGSEELRENGAENFSLREIAKRAGVSHNAPYRHFRDKTEFIDQLLERSLKELAEQILAAPLLYPASVILQARYIGRLWAQLALRHPRQAHLLFSGLGGPIHRPNTSIQAAHKLIHMNLTSVLEGARGTELPADFASEDIALVLISTFRGLAIMYTSHSLIEFMSEDESLFELFDFSAENILRVSFS